jgi:hypothetical protein
MRIETLKEIGKVRRCAHGLTKEIKTPEHKENRGADDMPDGEGKTTYIRIGYIDNVVPPC